MQKGCEIRVATIADDYIDHAGRPGQLAMAGIDAAHLVALAKDMLGEAEATRAEAP